MIICTGIGCNAEKNCRNNTKKLSVLFFFSIWLSCVQWGRQGEGCSRCLRISARQRLHTQVCSLPHRWHPTWLPGHWCKEFVDPTVGCYIGHRMWTFGATDGSLTWIECASLRQVDDVLRRAEVWETNHVGSDGRRGPRPPFVSLTSDPCIILTYTVVTSNVSSE